MNYHIIIYYIAGGNNMEKKPFNKKRLEFWNKVFKIAAVADIVVMSITAIYCNIAIYSQKKKMEEYLNRLNK